MNNRNTILYIIIGVLVLALGTGAYLLYEKSKENSEKDFKIEDLNTEIVDLEDDLKEMESEINNQDLEIEAKDKMLEDKEKQLAEKTKRIDQLLSSNKISAGEAEKLKSKIDQLNHYVKKYQLEIDSLKAQVSLLTDEKEELSGKVSNLEDEKHDLSQENLLNKTMLKAAAILKVTDFSFARVKGGGKEDEDIEFRAGKLKDLKICFKIQENTVAKAGERDLFLIFTDAKGNVIKTAGSGIFQHDKEDKTYTLKTTYNYNRTTSTVCQIFKKPDAYNFTKGDHKVTVYAEGYELGHGTVTVK